MLRAGATINELNAVRKHLSQVSGGQLAKLTQPAQLVTLILSDVVGNPLDVIASGPTVPDPTTFEAARAILKRYGIWADAPAGIRAHFEAGCRGAVPETPKPGDPLFERVQTVVVASNALAAEAAASEAARRGIDTLILSTFLEGEAREVARVVAALAREIDAHGRPLPRPCCLIAGGETTVTVRGNGRGGRNQELALAAALKLEGLRDVLLVALATDGSDGPTDAAGALADGGTLARARELGLDPVISLDDNDAFHFFEMLGDLLKTGPTLTNVNDLLFLFAF
jgi:hydroxypyruvate reductase